MPNSSIVVLALSTLDSEFQLDESAQRRTWARKDSKEVKVIWVRGGGSHFHDDGDRNLVVPAPEDFRSILAKTLLAIKWINTNLNPDVIIRSNTSSYFQLDKLKKVVNKFQQNQEDFGGYFESYNSERFINGAGIFLKRRAIEALSQMNPNDWIDIPDNIKIWYGDNFIKDVNPTPKACLRNFRVDTEMSTTSDEPIWDERKKEDYNNFINYLKNGQVTN